MTMTNEAFIDAAWTDHADRPEEVAERLAGALPQLQSKVDIPPFARIVTHVFGEHLARWNTGIDLLLSLRSLPCSAEPAGAHFPPGLPSLPLGEAGHFF